MTIRVYNTLTQRLEPFEPIDPPWVRMYVCGPTVYNKSHIGHAMSAIVFDTIRRYLQYRGYRVIHVMNFTDVDDQIIARANALGVDPFDLAQRYIDEWFEHVRSLNLLPAHYYPRVSLVIPQIIKIVRTLEEKGFAYEIDGNVYYRVRRFPNYGKLSRRNLEDARAGTRVAVDKRKEDPLDFALWKAAKPGEPSWESPWGAGRPGWHIECSAMVHYFLGEQIDIHGGGTDLIFPHHENEIAQSEAYTGKKPFARYWLHNGMLQLRGEKMSKSLGNLITIDDFLSEHESSVLRLIVLSSHYRKPLGFNNEVVVSAEKALQRLRNALRPPIVRDDRGGSTNMLRQRTRMARENFCKAMDNDFNTAGAIGHIFSLARAINAAREDEVGGEVFTHAQSTLLELLHVLGLELDTGVNAGDVQPYIEYLVEIRSALRNRKEWDLSDRIRMWLSERGITLDDTPGGTIWHKL